LFLPLLIIVLEIFSVRSRNQVLPTVIIYFIPLVIYALLNKSLTGYFITPGVSIFTNMSWALFLENYFLYAAKFFALYRLLPHEIKDILKLLFEYKTVVVLTCCATAVLLYIGFRKKISSNDSGRLIALMIVAFIISLLPVIHLETSFVGSPQSDRYGYLPSVFFVILVSGILALLNKRIIAIGVLCLLMIWFYTKVQVQNRNWVKAGSMVKKIVNEFKPADGVSYITNIPDNYNGEYFLRNGLSDAVSAINHRDYSGRIQVISYHTITSAGDKANAEKIAPSIYRVSFATTEKKIPASEKIYMLIPDTAQYSYSEVSDTSFVVTVKKLPAQNTFYYYSAGSLRVIQ
jgi:hypothetical protein